MQKLIVTGLLVAFAAGCGPSHDSHVKTPDEIIAEQEALGDEQLREEEESDMLGEVEETESEERAKFDRGQAKLELQRAGRSAETCPDALPDEEKAKVQNGTAEVKIWFENSGKVQKAELSSPYADTPVGDCILKAMEAVIVPAFEGEIVQVDWKLDIKKGKK